MPMQVIQQRQEPQREDDLAKAVKVLQVAGGVMGLKDMIDKQKQLEAQQRRQDEEFGLKKDAAARDKSMFESAEAERQRKARGELTMSDVAEMQRSGLAAAIPGAKGAVSYRVNRGDGNVEDMAFIKTRERAPVDSELAGMKKELLQSQIEAARGKVEEKEKGKQIPAGEAMAFGNSDAAFDALEKAKAVFKANEDISGPFAGRLAEAQSMFEVGEGGKKFKAYDAQLRSNAQVIGTYLEGGKLAEADINRYMKLLPNNLDSPDVAKDKASVLQNMIADRQNKQLTALKNAGYNTDGMGRMTPPENPNLPKAGAMMTPRYSPSDQEKAKKILEERMKIKEQGLAGAIRK